MKMNSKFKIPGLESFPGWVSGALFVAALVVLILVGILTS